MKVCRICNVGKSLCEFDKGRWQCRKCRNSQKLERAEEKRKLGVVLVERQVCISCGKDLPASGFNKNFVNTSNLQKTCRECQRLYKLESRYGVNKEKYDKLLEDQKGLCAICCESMTTPFLDHCHKSGKVRGLLCLGCNSGLGQFKDESQNLARAFSYLLENGE